jgi:hypothetical protein
MTKKNDDPDWVTVRIPFATAQKLATHAEKRNVNIEYLIALIVCTVANSDLVTAVLDD